MIEASAGGHQEIAALLLKSGRVVLPKNRRSFVPLKSPTQQRPLVMVQTESIASLLDNQRLRTEASPTAPKEDTSAGGGRGRNKGGFPTRNEDPDRGDYEKGKMRTVTIRLDDEIMELVEIVAKYQNRNKTAVVRDGIVAGVRLLAEQNPEVKEIQEGIVQRRINRQIDKVRRSLGIEREETED